MQNIDHSPKDHTLYYTDTTGEHMTLAQVGEELEEWLDTHRPDARLTQVAEGDGPGEWYGEYEDTNEGDYFNEPDRSDPDPDFHNSNHWDITTGSR